MTTDLMQSKGGRASAPASPRRKRRRPFHTTDEFSAGLFLLPALTGFTIFVLIPVIAAFAIAFFKWDLISSPQFVGLSNFARLPTDRVFVAALWNTAYYTIGVVVLSVSLGLLCAVLVTGTVRALGVARVLLVLPYVTVTVAMAIVWRWIYHPDLGLMNAFLGFFGIDGPNWLGSRSWAMPALIIMGVWKSFGYNMILFIAGLQAVPANLHEAARIDGASRQQRFWFITFPLLSPIMFFVTIISIISSFEVFDAALVMTGGGPGIATTTLVLHIYNTGFEAFDFGYASAIALALFAVIFAITMVQLFLQRKWVHYEE
jgi:multiple sugar transport system permease protein